MSSAQLSILNHPCGPLGYGLMGLTWREKTPSFDESIKVMKRALELGANNWNGGELYGTPDRNSMHLLKAYFEKYPEDADKIILNIKGGLEKGALIPNGSEENVRRSIDDCLAVIKDSPKSRIDIFECARVDPMRGNDAAIATLAQYVKEGKIGGIGLSEVSAKTIRRAQKQLTEELGVKEGVASVEIELSLWCPDPLNNGIVAACAEFGIPIFAYSPLARGALIDDPIRKNADISESDFRKSLPKFQDDVLEVNNQIIDAVKEIAAKKGVTMPQIAIAWVRGQSGRTKKIVDEQGQEKEVKLPTVIPIPGASSVARVEENFKEVVLSEEELQELDTLVEKFPVSGERYSGHGAKMVNG